MYQLLLEQLDLSRVKSMDIKNAVNSSHDTMHSALLRAKTYSKTKCCKDVIGKITTKCPLPASNTKASYSTDIQNHMLDFLKLPKKVVLVTQLCPTLFDPHGLQPTRLLCSWDFPDMDTGVVCQFLL